MANCSSCNGGCGTGTRVGALNSLCRTGCRFPYYTGPCPPAPCVDSCGNPVSSCCCCRRSAAVIDLNGGCNSCGNSCGCNGCGGARGYNTCASCGCGGCNACGSAYGRNSCDSCGNSCDSCGNSCGCGGCAADCGSNCGAAAHGVFTCGGPMNLTARGSVNFECRSAESGNFSVSYGSILIRRPGLYYVHVTADIPKSADVDTVMRLELDGQPVAPPELAISTGCGGGTANFSGCAIIHAGAGSMLKLVTLRDLCIETATAQPLFTISAMPIQHCCNH